MDKLYDSLDIGLVYAPYPLSNKDRTLIYDKINPGETIQEYLDRLNISVPEYMRDGLIANGVRVPYDIWHVTKFKHPVFITMSANVGDPVTAVFAIIAVVTVALSVYVAVTSIPPAALSQKQGTDGKQSPTYSISGGSNRSRLYEPMPLVFGKHLMFPDLAVTPYTRIEGSNQYLYQIFNFGINELTVADIKIGESLISNFNDVDTELSDFEKGTIDLFPGTTISVEGAVLEASNTEFTTRTSANNTTSLVIDLELQLTQINPPTGKFMSGQMNLVVQYRAVGDTTWIAFATRAQSGILIAKNDEIYIRNKGNNIVRRSIYLAVDEGQYEVRIRRRISTMDNNQYATRACNWIQLLSMQSDEAVYEHRMWLGVRIRATAQLSGTVDTLSAIVSNLIPVYDTSTGTETVQQSSNPGHLYIWFLRGAFDSDDLKRFGAGLPDSEIDLDGLREWADWCDVNELTFNAIIDTPQTVFETLQQIASAGRASPQLSLTQMSVVYDEEDKLPIQAFGMGSIIKDSFKVTYLSDNLPTEIVVNYIDEDRDYERNEVHQEVATLIDYGVEYNPLEVELFGVTNLSQAGRQANLIAASYVFRRRLIEFTVDIENLIATRGDVILIGHDLTAWSESGRLAGGVTFGAYTILVLDKEVAVGSSSFITIRDPDINLTTHTVTSTTSPTTVITISPALDIAPDANTTNLPKDYVWMFENDSSPGLMAKISDIKTQDNLFATITCVEDNPGYYLAEDSDYVFENVYKYNEELASVSNIRFSETFISLTGASDIYISWTSKQTASTDVTITINDGNYETYSGVTTNSITITATEGDVIDINILPNPIVPERDSGIAAVLSYTVLGLITLPDDVEQFSVSRNADTLSFTWSAVTNVDLKYYEIRRGATWGSSTLVVQIHSTVFTTTSYASGTFLIKAIDIGLRESLNSISTTSSVDPVNIVLTQEEADSNWNGTLSGLIVDSSNRLTLGSDGINTGTTWTDVIAIWDTLTAPWEDVTAYNSTGSYTTNSIDIGANTSTTWNEETNIWTAYTDPWEISGINFYARADVSLTTGVVDIDYTWASLDVEWFNYANNSWRASNAAPDYVLYVSTSNDNISFSDFRLFTPGSFQARYYKFRLDISKSETGNTVPVVSSMLITFDAEDITLTFNREAVPSTGRTFTFDEMNIIPNFQVTISEGDVGDVAYVSSATTSSVDIELFASRTQIRISGIINMTVTGY